MLMADFGWKVFMDKGLAPGSCLQSIELYGLKIQSILRKGLSGGMQAGQGGRSAKTDVPD